MTTLLLLYAQADVSSAEQIRTGLEAQGYRVWHEPSTRSLNDPAHPRTRAGVILSCAAVVLVWSVDAAQSSDVAPYLPLVQQLTKPMYALLLDNTALPQTLTPIVALSAQAPYAHVVAQLVPHLPSQQSADALFTLYEKAAHEYIPVRKEAIALAAEMLRRGEEQARVQAVLEYLASKDSITSVREMAQETLQAGAGMQPPSPQPHASPHVVEVSCPACGNVNYFDKRVICKGEVSIYRLTNLLSELSDLYKRDLYLECKKCGKPMVVPVDCKGYE
jgi:hypothetical protein